MQKQSFVKLFSVVLVLVLATALVTFAVSCRPAPEATEKIGLVVSILPLAEFVESVGKGKVDVAVMVPPGANPHTYELTPSQMVEVTKATMFVKVGSGVDFELAWMDKIVAANQDMLVIDSSRGVVLTGKDPHIWLSLQNAKIMVENICNGLIEVDPENRGYYTQNKEGYLTELDKLDGEIKENLAGFKNRRFIVFHPAWGYFARDYNLEQIPIEVGGKEPSAQDIARLVEEARKNDIKLIFASPQFNVKSAEVIAREIEGKVVFVDPLAKNYVTNMRMILGELVQGLE